MKLYQRLCNIILYIILIIFIVILLISIIQKKDIRFIFIRMKIKCFRIINKNKLIKNLEEIDSIMKKNNIFYWIGEGTALGSIRENDIIDGDDDIDIGIYEKEFNNKKKVLFKELKKKGFKIGSRKPLQIFKNGHYIDIDVTGKNRRFTGTDAETITSGTTGERVAGAGKLRFNTTLNLMEYYDGSNWVNYIGDGDITAATRIQGVRQGLYGGKIDRGR